MRKRERDAYEVRQAKKVLEEWKDTAKVDAVSESAWWYMMVKAVRTLHKHGVK